jgi:predicted helicase
LYEKQIADKFKELGYEVIERGKEKGKKDEGIDLIATKDNETLLIQCKNFAKTTQITQKTIRMFYGDCESFIKKYSPNKEDTKFIFIANAKESLSRSAKQYLNEQSKIIFKTIAYKILD